MIIPINFNTASTSSGRTLPPQLAQFGTDEVVLIELQGALDVEGDRQGEVVGKLTIDDATKKPTLLIGHHLLEGKLANLPKPLAVMQRSAPADPLNAEDEGTDGSVKVQNVEWNVVAIVKRKMIFSRRPMPMVGRVSVESVKDGGKVR